MPTRRFIAGLIACTLAACGGGSVTIGLGDGWWDEPSISLAASPQPVRAGGTLQVVAAVQSQGGVRLVDFFRLDNGQAVHIGTDDREPFEISTVVPADGRTSIQLFGRVTGNEREQVNSATIAVSVLP